jgi:hypothetical protein
MKTFNFVILSLVAVLVSTPSFAQGKKAAAAAPAAKVYARNYGMAGCGWGSLVFDKNGSQILAATTNGTFANQSFGITFGTANCDDDANSATAQRMDNFVIANKVALASDMAKGQGETLSNLAEIMGCSVSAQDLGQALQSNFRAIFPKADVTPNDVTDSIITVIRSNQNLSGSCKNVS